MKGIKLNNDNLMKTLINLEVFDFLEDNSIQQSERKSQSNIS